MKKQTPKRIWVRKLANGKYSFAEYIRVKRHNIIDPFKLDSEQVHALKLCIFRYRLATNGRPIEYVDDALKDDTEYQTFKKKFLVL